MDRPPAQFSSGAHTACFEAKSGGRNQVVVYHKRLEQRVGNVGNTPTVAPRALLTQRPSAKSRRSTGLKPKQEEKDFKGVPSVEAFLGDEDPINGKPNSQEGSHEAK